MKYKVHQLNIEMRRGKEKLEEFLNNLNGEVVSVIPNYADTSLTQIFGVSRKIDFLLIVEKTDQD